MDYKTGLGEDMKRCINCKSFSFKDQVYCDGCGPVFNYSNYEEREIKTSPKSDQAHPDHTDLNFNTFHNHPNLERTLGLDKDHVIIDYKTFIMVKEYLSRNYVMLIKDRLY